MAEANEKTFVFTKEAVKRSIAKLENQPIHEHFSGYLAILRARSAGNGLPVKVTDIKEFHDRFLHVVDAPDRSPYVRPFKSRGKGLELFNPNVAGSYSPASIRDGRPLYNVIDVIGSNRDARYQLKADHASLALKHLLFDMQVPVGSLVCFLYRDYGFKIEEPDIAHVVTIFREEFGLQSGNEGKEKTFNVLFGNDAAAFSASDFEVYQSSEGDLNA